MESTDVLIVGGGLVGASLALALKDLPLKVTLVESQIFPQVPTAENAPLRTIALSEGSRRIFESMGVWQSILPQAVPIRAVYVSEKGRFAKTCLDASEMRVPSLGYTIDAAMLQYALQEAVQKEMSGVVLSSSTVQRIEWSYPSKITIQTTMNEVLNYQAKLVVAADGTNSPVRQMAGISIDTKQEEQAALVVSVQMANALQGAYERFLGIGTIALLPLPDKMATVLWAAGTDEITALAALPDEILCERIREAMPKAVGRILAVTKRQQYPLTRMRAKKLYHPGLVLVGNAAQTLHPIGAQGFNLGLRDVQALAHLLQEALASGRSIQQISLLQTYARSRRFDHERTILLTNTLIKLFHHSSAWMGCGRQAGLFLLDCLTPVKNLFTKTAMGLVG